MKKFAIALMVPALLLALVGCSGKAPDGGGSATSSPDSSSSPEATAPASDASAPSPELSGSAPSASAPATETPAQPAFVAHDYVSPIGWYYCLDKANNEFLDIEKDWVVVFLGHNDAEGYDEYGLFDNMYVTEDNWQEMARKGYPPVVSYRVWYSPEGSSRKVARVDIRIPDANINKVDQYQAEKIQKYQFLLLKYLFDKLSDDQVTEIVGALGLTTQDEFASYRKGADASKFEPRRVEIYPDNTDSEPYVLETSYSAEYKTIVLTVR